MSTGPAHRFWRNTRRLTGALLGLWLAVTLLVPWFARDLGAWQVFGFPLGYWLAAKGALLLYLAIIVAYVGRLHPAGIVFYPRFFEIAHEAEEDWFRDAIGVPFRELIGVRREGFPVVAVTTRFHAPSRLGDDLDVAIGVARIGGASLDVHYALSCAGEARVDIRTTIVHTDLATGRPVPIGDDLRRRFEAFRIEGEGFETFGGYLLSHLGRVPLSGERFSVDELDVEVIEADRRRILRVRVHKRAPVGDGA